MLQFNLDHAIQVRNSIASFQAVYSEEWVDLIQRLQNLQQVWNDTHRLDFEQDFHNLTTIHQQIDQDFEHHLQEIDRVVAVVHSMQENLVPLSENTQPISTQAKTPPTPTPSSSPNSPEPVKESHPESAQINQVINQYGKSPDFLKSIAKNGQSLMMALTILTLSHSGVNTLLGNYLDAERSLRGPETSYQSKDNVPKKGSYRWVLDKLFTIENATPMGENFGDWADEGAEQMKKKKENEEKQEASYQHRQQTQTSAPK